MYMLYIGSPIGENNVYNVYNVLYVKYVIGGLRPRVRLWLTLYYKD